MTNNCWRSSNKMVFRLILSDIKTSSNPNIVMPLWSGLFSKLAASQSFRLTDTSSLVLSIENKLLTLVTVQPMMWLFDSLSLFITPWSIKTIIYLISFILNVIHNQFKRFTRWNVLKLWDKGFDLEIDINSPYSNWLSSSSSFK